MNNTATRAAKIANIAKSPNGVLIETITSLRNNNTPGMTQVLADLYTEIERTRPTVEAFIADIFDRDATEGRDYADLMVAALRKDSNDRFIAAHREGAAMLRR